MLALCTNCYFITESNKNAACLVSELIQMDYPECVNVISTQIFRLLNQTFSKCPHSKTAAALSHCHIGEMQ